MGLLAAGIPFFIGCVMWNYSPVLMGTMTLPILRALVLTGGLLQVPAPSFPMRIPSSTRHHRHRIHACDTALLMHSKTASPVPPDEH